MKYKAVIFDLFGTLVNNLSRREYESVLDEMASILAAPRDEFTQLWMDTSRERTTGIFPNPQTNIEYICQKLKIQVTGAQIEDAARVRLNYTARSLKPRPGSVEVLIRLKSEGYKTCLVSNCSGETPMVWGSTPFASLFDVAVFSSRAGIKKPDPRIYHMAIDQLAVKPQDCLYIGDGDSHELTGASQVGMHPVLLHVPDEFTDVHTIDREEWHDPVISSLKEVLTMVNQAQA
jgi:putative hydrolase of the HAD superfamily